MHGGEIGCDSTPRKSPDDIASGGSEFYFSIKHDEAAAMEYEVQKYRAALEVSKPNLIVRSESTNSLTIYPSSVDTSAGGPQLQGINNYFNFRLLSCFSFLLHVVLLRRV